MAATMKAWRFHEFGSIRNLRLEETTIPQPVEGETLVRVRYAALNPADRFVVMGRYPHLGTPPYSVGRDGCGVVVQPAPGSPLRPGDPVVLLRSWVGITRDGSLAEYMSVPDAALAPLPAWWSPAEGAAGPLVLLTCWQALVQAGRFSAGETVLITGASGGIGTAGVLLAKALGASVIALSRDAVKRDRLVELGADAALDPSDPDLVEIVRKGGGADVILENVCGPTLQRSLEMANHGGRVCIIGALGGIASEINPLSLLFERREIHGIHVGDFTEAEAREAWEKMTALFAPRQVRPVIDRIFPFDQVQEAFEYMKGGPMGKVVIGPVSAD